MSGGPSGSAPERSEAGPLVLSLRRELDRYEAGRSAQALDGAFAAAARAVAQLRGERAQEPPEVSEIRDLF